MLKYITQQNTFQNLAISQNLQFHKFATTLKQKPTPKQSQPKELFFQHRWAKGNSHANFCQEHLLVYFLVDQGPFSSVIGSHCFAVSKGFKARDPVHLLGAMIPGVTSAAGTFSIASQHKGK